MIIDCHGHYTTAPKTLHDKRVSNIRDLTPVLEQVAKAGRPICAQCA